MIKYDKGSVEITGNGIDVLTELGVLTEQVIVIMQRDIPREIVVGAVMSAINGAIELSNQKDSEEQKRMQEVAEILKNMKESEGTEDAD